MGSISWEKKNVKKKNKIKNYLSSNRIFLSSFEGLEWRNCLLRPESCEAEVCIEACMFLFDFDHQQIFDGNAEH